MTVIGILLLLRGLIYSKQHFGKSESGCCREAGVVEGLNIVKQHFGKSEAWLLYGDDC